MHPCCLLERLHGWHHAGCTLTCSKLMSKLLQRQSCPWATGDNTIGSNIALVFNTRAYTQIRCSAAVTAVYCSAIAVEQHLAHPPAHCSHHRPCQHYCCKSSTGGSIGSSVYAPGGLSMAQRKRGRGWESERRSINTPQQRRCINTTCVEDALDTTFGQGTYQHL
jgi:hypothetical protein